VCTRVSEFDPPKLARLKKSFARFISVCHKKRT